MRFSGAVMRALGQWILFLSVCFCGPDVCPIRAATAPRADPAWLAPTALVAGENTARLFLACAQGQTILEIDPADGRSLRAFPLTGPPTGLAWLSHPQRLLVSTAGPKGHIVELDPISGRHFLWKGGGYELCSPVVSPDGAWVLAAARYQNEVILWETASQRVLRRIPVGREPVSLALLPDGHRLLVAHHLPAGRADVPYVAATVRLIQIPEGATLKEWTLPNGSGLLREIQVSPDGRAAVVVHDVARFQMPTTQLERGWMNTSALTWFDLDRLERLGTVLLDEVDHGAANPWAARWTPDGKRLYVTHAGTHELSVIDAAGLRERLAQRAAAAAKRPSAEQGEWAAAAADDDDLALLLGLRRRVALRGNGPRALGVAGASVVVASYFSDTLEILDASDPARNSRVVSLSPDAKPSPLRLGEMFFNDASLCFQGWQSCASCHSDDARVDGLNWDLLNDGIGNPKNVKSLLWSYITPPAMSLGVRDTAHTATRSGLRYILFASPPGEVAASLDAWLTSLSPLPSPHLVEGRLGEAARRGKKLFESKPTGCATCHAGTLFTDLKTYDVGTAGAFDHPGDAFDTPTLAECWRTAPYLHDGSAATLLDVLTARNPQDRHGRTQQLTEAQRRDLVAYLLSL